VKVWVYRGDRLANGEAPQLPKTEGDNDRRDRRGPRPAAVRVPRVAVAAPAATVVPAYRCRPRRQAGRAGRRWPKGPAVKRVRRAAPPPPLRRRRDQRRITMLQPARRKYRKEQKGRNTGIATRGANVSFGDFGLKATERGRITARQIEAARRAISRHIKRGGRIFIRIFPDKPISQKPAEVRMGNGKGNPEYYVAEIQPGKVLYEINGVPEQLAREAFTLASPSCRCAAPSSPARSAPEARINMKTSELRAKDIAALEKEVSDLLKAHFGLRMQKATQQLTNHTQLGNTRRDMARVKTIIAEKKRQQGAAK
jgi:large subunit ribosomal protein L16